MEHKCLIRTISVLLLSLASRSASDDYDFDNAGDGGLCGSSSQSLGDGCSISGDCSTITCQTAFVKHPITLTLKVNKCEEPVTVTASMDVPDFSITWSHTYTSDDVVEVPGFTFSKLGFSAGVYVKVELTPNDASGNLHLKVTLLGGGEVLGKTSYPLKLPIIDGDLPISTDDCGFIAWWNNLSDILKAAVIGGPVLLILVLVMCCYCCCCKSGSAAKGGAIIVTAPPQAVVATSTNRTVPMRPLVNEM